ncbi:hypothetical protein [Leucobacter triazinivorans]|uniref:Uncharacterized protein n=1 Tax=Leucobacter triazinivorans TaxID=1784719 RepID=A0A4P6KH85_9MICO|nr:hypothetical protein [Leucobacter triazinivorans]QBE49895.1 hypothetical protein EVS81_14530 [Leucobacter triazinivorans]
MKTALGTAGGPGPEEYREWLARGFTLLQAREWLVDGVDLGEAERWRARGIGTASAALPLRVRGITPQSYTPTTRRARRRAQRGATAA